MGWLVRSLAGIIAVSACAAMAQPAQPQTPPSPPPTLGEWLARDLAAGRAPPSPARDADVTALMQQVVDGLKAARAAEDARAAAGEPPRACLPPPGAAQLTSQDIGTWLHARPVAEHAEPLPIVLARFLAARFPCF